MRDAFRSMHAFVFAAALLAVFSAPTLAIAATGAPVAMVSDLHGKAAIVSGGAKAPLALLADVQPGAQIDLDAGARLVLLYLDGSGEYVFAGPALIAVRAQQAQTLKGAPAQKRNVLGGKAGDVKLKPLGAVQGALVMRSSGARGRIRLLSPVGNRVVDVAPEFRWQHGETGVTYRFELIDGGGNTVHESETSGTSLKLPASVKLSENVQYSWTVSTRTSDGRKISSGSDFTVAPATVRQQIAALKPAAGAAVSERVAYAAWLEQLEVKDEARAIWRALAAERPDDERLQTLARE